MRDVSAVATSLETIQNWRAMHRLEMSCQIVHDSIHDRPGWTKEYLLSLAATPVGYGSVAVGGPWEGTPTAFEFYVVPTERLDSAHVPDSATRASGGTSQVGASLPCGQGRRILRGPSTRSPRGLRAIAVQTRSVGTTQSFIPHSPASMRRFSGSG